MRQLKFVDHKTIQDDDLLYRRINTAHPPKPDGSPSSVNFRLKPVSGIERIWEFSVQIKSLADKHSLSITDLINDKNPFLVSLKVSNIRKMEIEYEGEKLEILIYINLSPTSDEPAHGNVFFIGELSNSKNQRLSKEFAKLAKWEIKPPN